MTASKPVSPLWRKAYQRAAAIPPSVHPDPVKRRLAIHRWAQAVLRAIRGERS